MKQWEYHRVNHSDMPAGRLLNTDAGKLGRDGWELVGFDNEGHAWFKRDIDARNTHPKRARGECP